MRKLLFFSGVGGENFFLPLRKWLLRQSFRLNFPFASNNVIYTLQNLWLPVKYRVSWFDEITESSHRTSSYKGNCNFSGQDPIQTKSSGPSHVLFHEVIMKSEAGGKVLTYFVQNLSPCTKSFVFGINYRGMTPDKFKFKKVPFHVLLIARFFSPLSFFLSRRYEAASNLIAFDLKWKILHAKNLLP